MSSFQNIVMSIASVILIIVLIFIGISLYNNKKHSAYPPVIADCPDYWLDMSNDDSNRCVNSKNLGSCNTKDMDFSSSFWTGSDGLCRKYKWARKCDLTWDGVTTNSNICNRNP